MARNRSSRNRRRNRRGGLLVHEPVIQRGVGSTGLYSIPVHITDLGQGSKIVIRRDSNGVSYAGAVYLYVLNANGDEIYTKEIVPRSDVSNQDRETVIRISSLTVSGDSPFYVDVRTPRANVLYQVPGEKVTKIVPSRENSIMGNPALFNNAVRSATTTDTVLCEIDGAESGVDCTVYLVCGTML